MKKLNDFEYDLWTTEDGRCMVQVRLTKEECEVDRETFRLLRAEEKRLRREQTPEKRNAIADEAAKHPLSLDILDSDAEGSFWHSDPDNMEEHIILNLAQKEFWNGLTPTQQKIYWLVIINGLSYKRCADICGVTYQAVQNSLRKIQKKQKFFWIGGCDLFIEYPLSSEGIKYPSSPAQPGGGPIRPKGCRGRHPRHDLIHLQ